MNLELRKIILNVRVNRFSVMARVALRGIYKNSNESFLEYWKHKIYFEYKLLSSEILVDLFFLYTKLMIYFGFQKEFILDKEFVVAP